MAGGTFLNRRGHSPDRRTRTRTAKREEGITLVADVVKKGRFSQALRKSNENLGSKEIIAKYHAQRASRSKEHLSAEPINTRRKGTQNYKGRSSAENLRRRSTLGFSDEHAEGPPHYQEKRPSGRASSSYLMQKGSHHHQKNSGSRPSTDRSWVPKQGSREYTYSSNQGTKTGSGGKPPKASYYGKKRSETQQLPWMSDRIEPSSAQPVDSSAHLRHDGGKRSQEQFRRKYQPERERRPETRRVDSANHSQPPPQVNSAKQSSQQQHGTSSKLSSQQQRPEPEPKQITIPEIPPCTTPPQNYSQEKVDGELLPVDKTQSSSRRLIKNGSGSARHPKNPDAPPRMREDWRRPPPNGSADPVPFSATDQPARRSTRRLPAHHLRVDVDEILNVGRKMRLKKEIGPDRQKAFEWLSLHRGGDREHGPEFAANLRRAVGDIIIAKELLPKVARELVEHSVFSGEDARIFLEQLNQYKEVSINLMAQTLRHTRKQQRANH